MKAFPSLLLCGALLTLAGCASVETVSYAPLTGDPVTDGQTMISRAPARDRMLWQYRTAAIAMRRGRFAEAKALLDDALITLNGIYGKAVDAQKARSYFNEESKKKFIGEPFERVMAYYYRGILYWMDGEPDNARACFRSAQLADSDAEDKTYASDYAVLDYLDGLASFKLHADGSDAFKRAVELSKTDSPPAYDEHANVLFFIECGNGPTKYAMGEYGDQLRFRAGNSGAHSAVVRVGGQALRARAYDDLYFQATTRGGRVMDHVLAGKAVFKDATDNIGTVALISGAVLATNRRTQNVGIGLALAGLVGKVVSAATTPAADTRSWDNLPQYLCFTTAQLPVGQHAVTVEFQSASGAAMPSLTKSFTVNVTTTERDTVVFLSDKSKLN